MLLLLVEPVEMVECTDNADKCRKCEMVLTVTDIRRTVQCQEQRGMVV